MWRATLRVVRRNKPAALQNDSHSRLWIFIVSQIRKKLKKNNNNSNTGYAYRFLIIISVFIDRRWMNERKKRKMKVHRMNDVGEAAVTSGPNH